MPRRRRHDSSRFRQGHVDMIGYRAACEWVASNVDPAAPEGTVIGAHFVRMLADLSGRTPYEVGYDIAYIVDPGAAAEFNRRYLSGPDTVQ